MLTASLILSALTIISFLLLKYNRFYYESISTLDQDSTLEDIILMHIFFILPIFNLIAAAVTLSMLAINILVSIGAIIQFLVRFVKANHEH